MKKKSQYYQFRDTPIKEVTRKMKAQGFEVFQGNERQLLLDLDSPEAVATYRDRLGLAKRFFKIEEKQRWISKSGKGLHVILESANKLSAMLRLLIQVYLGSDPKREIFGAMRVLNGEKNPSLLFKPGIGGVDERSK